MKQREKSLFMQIIEIFSNLSLAMMFMIVMLGVITRYIMKSPFFWTDELSRYLMIYMVFLGSTLSFRAEKHPSLTFIIDKLPAKWRFAWDSIIDILLLAVLVMLTIGGWEMMTSKPIGTTAALRIKYTWVYLTIPLGGVSMIAEIALRFYRRLIKFRKKVPESASHETTEKDT
jgi:TRAP-type C4-dicarboxylate transport system permease small subunit